eukprot:SAG22_NODE_127_length_18798_cov_11.748757_12_plen_57_part_01
MWGRQIRWAMVRVEDERLLSDLCQPSRWLCVYRGYFEALFGREGPFSLGRVTRFTPD